MRTRLQGSAELDDVRAAIGLRPAQPSVTWPEPYEPVGENPRTHWDPARQRGSRAGSLSGRMRLSVGLVAAISCGVALTHQLLAGALAGVPGAGPWHAAATLLGWPAPVLQPILAGVGALVLCALGVLTGAWRRIGPRENRALLAGTVVAVLGAGPMVVVCALAAAVCALAVALGLVILFYLLAALLR